MPSISALQELATLASSDLPPEEAVQRALPLLQDGLGARDVFFVYGEGSSSFRAFGTSADIDLSDIALWLVHQDLVSRKTPRAFEVHNGHVATFCDLPEDGGCDHIAAMIPMADRKTEMLIAQGPWPDGLPQEQRAFLEASLPALALVLERRLDAFRAERQRQQLNALASVTRVMSESHDLEDVLSSMAATTAALCGVDYVSVDLTAPDSTVTLRVVNSTRPDDGQLRNRWRKGADRPDPVRDMVLRTRRPMLFPEAQTDGRIPENGRNFFVRTLIRSTAVLPLLAKDEVLGVVAVASHEPVTFSAQQVELLEALAAQMATAIKGIQLYQELIESRHELERLNDQLQQSMSIEHHLARTDPLTGIPNRRLIDETIEAERARAWRYGHPLSVIVADLDHLKEINDAYGHAVGDEVLRLIASLARQSCREVDIVGRYGGDEFVFVLPSTSLEEAAILAERFRNALAERVLTTPAGDPIVITASLGVAEWGHESSQRAGSLIRLADKALYEAKSGGRNRTMTAAGNGAHAA